ncbi:MAG: MG2 domain-containing protein [Bacteroidales bacterium]|nr:MG2 domain-containing protein [Bacteroidales bacterium]
MNAQSIDKLWKSYDEAIAADKPKTAMSVLEKIKESAKEQRLAWDYYQACLKYVDAGSSINWKDREVLNIQKEQEISDFDEPVLTFFHTRGSFSASAQREMIAKHKEVLKAGKHHEFWVNDNRLYYKSFRDFLVENFENDYEYVLWSLYAYGDATAKTDLDALYGGQYPKAALVEFSFTSKSNENEMKEYAAKYRGKAVALLARQELLTMERAKLDHDGNSKQEQYIALRKECTQFVNDQKKFTGSEKKIAECATMVDELISTLDNKSISFEIEKSVMTVRFQNVDKVNYTITKDGKKVEEGTVKNTENRYYLQDKATHKLTSLDDGSYLVTISAGKLSEELDYEKYSASIAVKKDSKGHAIFVADAWTGKPVERCDVQIVKDEKVLAEKKDVALKGFTYLPAELEAVIERYGTSVICSFKDASGRLHRTKKGGIDGYPVSTFTKYDTVDGVLIQDRAAFHPGESVHVKGILYHGDRRVGYDTVEEGTEVIIFLKDPQGDLVEKKTLKTNKFGSVACEFALPADRRKGQYEISMQSGKKDLAFNYIQVDEYVLPTFELKFDPMEKFYLCGDEVKVTGTIKSYTGHSLSGADIKYTATVDGNVVGSGKLQLSSGGRFSVTVPADKKKADDWYSYASVEVTVTDATGETHDWTKTVAMDRYIPIGMSIENANEGNITPIVDNAVNSGMNIITDDFVKMAFKVKKHDTLDITYTVFSGKVIVAKGKAEAGSIKEIDLTGKPSGCYRVNVKATAKNVAGKLIEEENDYMIVKISESDTSYGVQSESIISLVKGDDMAIQMGAGLDELWAIVEIIGEGEVTLKSDLVHIRKGELKTIRYAFDPSYSNSVLMKVLYFKDGRYQQWSKAFTNERKSLNLPLGFSRFVDKAQPGNVCHFEMTTLPGVECAVSIYDKSTEAIKSNEWMGVSLSPITASMRYELYAGMDRSSYHYRAIEFGSARVKGGRVMMNKAVVSEAVEEEAAMVEPMVMSDNASIEKAVEEVQEPAVREDFAGTIAFEPFLHSDSEGKVSFDVTAGDLLSTFYVYVYGHDKSMRNAILRDEMVVTIPVKLSVVEPQLLYVGDRYVVKANLSSTLASECGGTISMSLFDGKDYKQTKPFMTKSMAVNIPAGGSTPVEFEVNVPAINELGILLKFTAAAASDAVFVTVPVKPAKQTLTEAHSAVLHVGESESELEAKLRSMFVNVQGSEADMKVTSLIDLVREALPGLVEPDGKNSLALAEALYARLLSAKLGSPSADNNEIVESLLKLQNADGGFAWFEDMSSSGIVTAQILEMAGTAKERGLQLLPAESIEKAIHFLDNTYFSKDNKYRWFCTVSMAQYLYIRALFTEVEFSPVKLDRKEYREFKKDASRYLVPKKERGMNGYILGKARRLRTLMLLTSSEKGVDLAGSFGLKFRAAARMEKSIRADIASLLEYAVEHKSGGMYYPNAVMPFRGLLETELSAHSLLCDLLRDCTKRGFIADEKVSDGIRLWLMIQKETQQWASDPAYVEAIGSVLDGSEEILATKIMSLSKTYTVPFEVIQASGNGMSVKRRFFLVNKEESRHEIAEGEILHVGDKVEALYEIWSEENRSFIHLNASRPGSLRPIQQLSGHYGWWLSPLRINDFYTFSPQGYREVGIAGSDYWFDAYPEEKTTISEYFHVTQEGSFQMPVIEIECLYAPHYRANDASHHCPMVSE